MGGLLSSCLVVLAVSAQEGRHQPRDPRSLTVPRRAVGRKDYVDLVRPLVRGFESGPDRGPYGLRHALPALAVFALEGDARLGEGIKKTVRHYGDWVKASIEKEKGVFSMEGGTLLGFYAREFRRHGLMTPEDEAWFRDLLLALRRHHYAWRPGDGLWRGSHHRSQNQGSLHALAAAFFPGEPEAPKWKAYADKVWDDWWSFRDVGINDTGYFYSSFNTVLRTAELLGRREVFTDPRSKKIFDRILYELAPDGGAVPYGASGGYHSAAGIEVLADEPGLAAVKVAAEGGAEVAILNAAGARVELDSRGSGKISTDARAAYVEVRSGSVRRAAAFQATRLQHGGTAVFSSDRRRDFERGGP